ncbi:MULTISPECIES: hypothetical protein [unclassified Sphingomonas]|uniref:hypothetical protein n=1 Tax=unclassified Sphingomonas TaxID=196159 RepID=UPI000AD92D84|nr:MULTISPECIES: hypothetical protein [unclassified Sphingomonas]
MKNGWRVALLAGSGLLLATGMAGCSDKAPEDAPIENSAFDEGAPPPTPLPEENIETAPPLVTENLSAVAPAEVLPPPPPVEPDQQVLDDASATGMTSRSTRGQSSSDDDAPVDDTMSNQQEADAPNG